MVSLPTDISTGDDNHIPQTNEVHARLKVVTPATDADPGVNIATIQAAIDAVNSAGGGVIILQPGSYEIERHSTDTWCIDGKSNVTILGYGAELTLADSQTASNLRLIRANNISNFAVIGLRLDGNRANQTPTSGGQWAGIFILDGTDIHVRDCNIQDCYGDAVYVGASVGTSQRVHVIDNHMAGCGRRGVAIVEAENVWVRGNHIVAGADGETPSGGVILELNGASPLTNYWIEQNYCEIPAGSTGSAFGFDGKTGGANYQHVYARGNIFNNSSGSANEVPFSYAVNVVFEGNHLIDLSLRLRLTADNVQVVNNQISVTNGTQSGIYVSGDGSENPTLVHIADNQIEVAGGQNGIQIYDGLQVHVDNNDIIGDGTTSQFAIEVRPVAVDISDVKITGNRAKNCGRFLYLYSSDGIYTIDGVVIADNIGDTFTSSSPAIEIATSTHRETVTNLALGNNIVRNATGADLTINIQAGGNPVQIGAMQYSGYGEPESNVTAPVGALYLRRDGGANTTLYIKESGAGDTGWAAV